MMVRIYGFDWETYTLHVMPAFARWLIESDNTAVYQLYQQTRCSREDQFVPSVMQHLCAWPRALTFVKQLPRGPHTLEEYQILCDAEQFTFLSDSYAHRHPPQLYQNSEALRIVWGGIVEDYCLLPPFLSNADFIHPKDAGSTEPSTMTPEEEETLRNEVTSLLQSVGLTGLAQEFNERDQANDHPSEQNAATNETEEAFSGLPAMDEQAAIPGVELGRLPTTLHLRGWLAARSVRAMALFEMLVCGRRRMPFGYSAGQPYETFIGYLTPEEVWQLAHSVHDLQPPSPIEAEEDHLLHRLQQSRQTGEFRLIDEVLPAHAGIFLTVVNAAAQHGTGLICNVD